MNIVKNRVTLEDIAAEITERHYFTALDGINQVAANEGDNIYWSSTSTAAAPTTTSTRATFRGVRAMF
jgi:hypothetical protein